MKQLRPQFVIDEQSNRKAVLISSEEWDYLLEELETLEDLRAYDEAKAQGNDSVSLESAVREIQADYKV